MSMNASCRIDLHSKRGEEALEGVHSSDTLVFDVTSRIHASSSLCVCMYGSDAHGAPEQEE